MEVFLRLFLSLPNHMGGLGLSGGVFNHPIDVDGTSGRLLGQQVCYVDYYFPALKLGYEYQGEQHNYTIDQDARRLTLLGALGYRMIPVTKSQLYLPELRRAFFVRVLRAHHVKQRIRTEKYGQSLERLHELLPRWG